MQIMYDYRNIFYEFGRFIFFHLTVIRRMPFIYNMLFTYIMSNLQKNECQNFGFNFVRMLSKKNYASTQKDNMLHYEKKQWFL